MPKVFLTESQQIQNKLIHCINNGCSDKHITQEYLEHKLHLSHSAFWRKKKSGDFTADELRQIFSILETSDDEILGVFGR